MASDDLAEGVLESAGTQGVFSAIRLLSEHDEPTSYREAMRLAYWEHKDLPLALTIATAGVSRLLADATGLADEEAYVVRSEAKALLYDTASFSWPGWGEPGVNITVGQQQGGLAAAQANLAMAQELDKGDLPRSRAHWMLGAHLLTNGNCTDAATEFTLASETASRADSEPDVGLARSFAALTRVASGDAGAPESLAAELAYLGGLEHGDMFVAQVTTCRDVLDLS